MLLACLWPCLCPCAVGCGSFESLAHGSQSTPTLAPRRTTPFAQQKGKERLLSCWPAAATTTATAIITIVVQLLPKHYVVFPPTSRCYRSTINASHVRLITIWLIWSVFLPGSRAALVATNNASDAVVGGSQLAEPDYLHTSCLLYTSPSPRDATLSRMPSSA